MKKKLLTFLKVGSGRSAGAYRVGMVQRLGHQPVYVAVVPNLRYVVEPQCAT